AALVGATDTSFHVIGQQFSGNASITFLLDGQPAPGTQAVQSDSNGNVQADLPVTPDWSVGRHTLTARDDQNFVTKAEDHRGWVNSVAFSPDGRLALTGSDDRTARVWGWRAGGNWPGWRATCTGCTAWPSPPMGGWQFAVMALGASAVGSGRG